MMKMFKKPGKYIFLLILAFFCVAVNPGRVYGTTNLLEIPNVSISIGDNPAEGEVPASSTMQLLFLITIISLAPSLLIMLTSFTRILIVLHFVRNALGTQQMPPNQIIIGLSLFLTMFIMNPVITTVNDTALKPYSEGAISQREMIDIAMEPIRGFMFDQVSDKDLALFCELSGREYASIEEIPSSVLIPSFILSELSKGFIFGFFIYIPFIVIDMVVSSILMAMGMMMLPPAMISSPFKILLFILVGGWSYIIEILARSFNV